MQDLYIAFAIVTLGWFACFLLTLKLTVNLSGRTFDYIALLIVAGIASHIFWMRDQVWWTKLFPWSNLVVLSNLVAPGVGILSALVWRRIEGTAALSRKLMAFSLLTVVAGYATVQPVMGEPEGLFAPVSDWQHGVCLQSTKYTCSPAAAATVLRHYGIETSEREMAELCLTRRGTTWQGIYRGLKLKTKNTPYDVEVFDNKSLSELRRLSDGPVLLSVELKKDALADPIYADQWGWVPGQPHSVVYFGLTNYRAYEMGDPSIGRESWTTADMEILWHGQGLRLVKRQPTVAGHNLAATR